MSSIAADYTRHTSLMDASLNFSKTTSDGGMIETRFVQRTPDRFIVYISSMTGCDKACRFCWLTQTGQTMNTILSREQMLEQAETVLSQANYPEAETVHFNFMARGEPMSNINVDRHLFVALKDIAEKYGLKARIKLSSIIPTDFDGQISRLYDDDCPPIDFYYSLYSMDPAWRKRWIPKAKSPTEALKWLQEWQAETGNRVILHWALIDRENTDIRTIDEVDLVAQEIGLSYDFNLVRYNPANEKSSEAPIEVIERFTSHVASTLNGKGRMKVIPRVGYDVKASCGMFLSQNERLSGFKCGMRG